MSEPSNTALIANFIANLTSEPGVYQMLDGEGCVLYVGKASNLKKRVSSYFNKQHQPIKTQSLVSQIQSIDIRVTRSETEALLLESNLIKTLRPKYNILMRDDKSYPYIYISTGKFPRIQSIRLRKKPQKGDYFGPYPNTTAVKDTLNLIQKIFKIRNCTDSFFNARTRPCLQYQINRCGAPCMAFVSELQYQQLLSDAKSFLQGKSGQILDALTMRMQTAASLYAFEEAALLRDQIKSLRLVQEQQGVVQLKGDLDAIAIEAQAGFAAIMCVTVRQGQVLASQVFFPSMPTYGLDDETSLWEAVFEAFIAHYYIDAPERIPALILVNNGLHNFGSQQTMLRELRGKACVIQSNPRGANARWLDFSVNNLQQSIAEHRRSLHTISERYKHLCALIEAPFPIKRMECFDISHTQGIQTVASCVVFDEHGPCPRQYRQFNITDITPGDDYAAMDQALTRRFKRLLQENNLPNVLIIDGGKGQIAVAKRVFEALAVQGVTLIGIAKGPSRKAGFERLILDNQPQEITLATDSPALHLLQHIRDEAHRFAITKHRKKRQNSSFSSSLETIEGVGAKRRRALLARFGGLRELAKASVAEIAKVPGISEILAQKIYQHFRL